MQPSGKGEHMGPQAQQGPSHSTCLGDWGTSELVATSSQESRATQESRSSNAAGMRGVQYEARRTRHRLEPGPAMARQVHGDGARQNVRLQVEVLDQQSPSPGTEGAEQDTSTSPAQLPQELVAPAELK